MACFINATVGIKSILGGGEDGIKVGLSNVGFEAIDIPQGGITVHGKAVWTKSNKPAWKGISACMAFNLLHWLTVFLMTPEELQVAITFPGMIDRIPIRNLCPKRPRIFGQRMECQSIKSNCEDLKRQVR